MINACRRLMPSRNTELTIAFGAMLSAWFCSTALRAEKPDAEGPSLLLVVGAPGTDEYGQHFQAWARRWIQLSTQHSFPVVSIGIAGNDVGGQSTEKTRLKQAVKQLHQQSTSPAWIILIGHGTFDRNTAKFNLRGPDVSAAELAEWLSGCRRPVVIVNCSASSGPFINRLSGAERTVITATNSGFELNYSRFGDYFSQAIADPSSDLNKDRQVSLLEAVLAASAAVNEYYEQDGRLVTEHALIDDNGDGLGTPASWFRGVRAIKKAKGDAPADGVNARQLHLVLSADERALPVDLKTQRDQLERDIEKLRMLKDRLNEDDYYDRLESLVVPLARIYAERDTGSKAKTKNEPKKPGK